MNTQSAFLIAGTRSGCGKTTVTLGIMAALVRRGLQVQPFKCGPDFIDPTLHKRVTGIISRNLDVRMCGENFVRQNFSRLMHNREISIIEGVMGLFDGGTGSAASLAKLLNIPVILVVDVRSAAESVAAVIKGFETLDPDIRFAGVILNRVGSKRHEQLITNAVRQHCRTRIIGVLPRSEEVSIPSRHLGLHMGTETELNQKYLATWISSHIDLDLLLKSGANNKCQPVTPTPQPVTSPQKIRLGVARDAAFCFYYEDNLDMLRAGGAEIIEFSPLHDQTLPADLHALYIGGGYPELYAEKLSANREILNSIHQFSQAGNPVYAECGGFMYLTRGIVDIQGKIQIMAGVYPVTARMKPRLSRLGYRKATLSSPTFFGRKGLELHGHEFHYSTIDDMPREITRAYQLDDGRDEGYLINNTLGGYLHLHFGSTPEAVSTFIEQCR